MATPTRTQTASPSLTTSKLGNPDPNSPFKQGDIVFVEPIDKAIKCWRAAMIVPFEEIDPLMNISHLNFDTYIVRFFGENSFTLVTSQNMKHFNQNSQAFQKFVQINPTFQDDPAIIKACVYQNSGYVEKEFKWLLWGKSNLYRSKLGDPVNSIRPVAPAQTLTTQPLKKQESMDIFKDNQGNPLTHLDRQTKLKNILKRINEAKLLSKEFEFEIEALKKKPSLKNLSRVKQGLVSCQKMRGIMQQEIGNVMGIDLAIDLNDKSVGNSKRKKVL